ncbi:DUF4810 domain-containing protein [Nitrospira sp. KM1]|uniref:DUF4810 domain-containing protein n=1 Tax=Nitrospira sp. KM1 TaxID=1936990 RepID=UPI0013A731C9|nr:DUF4810 domain-containing protein [Nitrospira sp. KM1]BCA52977.1 DUF4810 domain-containing protein [Nitrospira sp. KM1]
MIRRTIPRTAFCALLLSLATCGPSTHFYWGSYEDSLLTRHQNAGEQGESSAATMLATTINEAPTDGKHNVAPGVHADYGYLLFKQGKVDDAIAELQKEAALYPESQPLMYNMISRMQDRKTPEPQQGLEKKPAS